MTLRRDLACHAAMAAVVLASLLLPLLAAGDGREKIAQGERFYRLGLDVEDQPAAAVSEENVRSTSANLNCASCHLGSGRGSAESGRVAPSVRWSDLTREGRNAHGKRPAYDRRSFARAVAEGLDSAGRPLNPLMPRYRVDEQTLHALLDYLVDRDGLREPGVQAATIDLATVITPDADPDRAAAMLEVLERFIAEQSKAPPPTEGRGTDVDNGGERRRAWRLQVWRLTGSSDQWADQLIVRHRSRPVFALLAGIGAAQWQPVHDFCVAEALPCLLPIVDVTPRGVGQGLAVYYSRGLALEARLALAEARRAGVPRIAQVVGSSPRARVAAAELRAAAEELGIEVVDRPLAPTSAESQAEASYIVLWLQPSELAAVQGVGSVSRLLLSSTLLGGDVPRSSPLTLTLPTTLLHPFALPQEFSKRIVLLLDWLRTMDLPRRDLATQEQALFACRLLAQTLLHCDGIHEREYLIEKIDHTTGPLTNVANYPRLTYGRGQRILAKGGYVIDLEPPGAPRWVVP